LLLLLLATVVLTTMLLLTMMLLLMMTTMLLPSMLLATMVILARITTIATAMMAGRGRHFAHIATLEVNKDAALILLGTVLQSEFPAHLLDARFNLLHMSGAVVSLADNDMQMAFSALARSAYPLFERIFGFFYEESVQVNRIAFDATLGVVFAENKIACLAVVVVHLCGMRFAFLR
jgi:hypothetical protein